MICSEITFHGRREKIYSVPTSNPHFRVEYLYSRGSLKAVNQIYASQCINLFTFVAGNIRIITYGITNFG